MKEKEKKIPMTLQVPIPLKKMEKMAVPWFRSVPQEALYLIVLGRDCEQRGEQK